MGDTKEDEAFVSALVDEHDLAHYGIKGMRWGVRRSDEELARAGGGDKVRVKKTPGKKVEVISGGKNQSASDDAVKAAIARTKASKSSIDSLSNQELKALVDRMNLEQKYSNLSVKNASTSSSKPKKFLKAGAKFASDVLLNAGKQVATKQVASKMDAVLTEALAKKK